MARNSWNTRTAFLFAAIGSAVGLGNLWRFPYMVEQYGGGAFLIPYLIALFVIGAPLLLLEFAIGQKMQLGAAHAFKSVHGRLSGIGWGALFATFTVVVYYAAVMAWALVYFFKSFTTSTLPWAADSSGFFFGSVLNISDGVGQVGGLVPHLVIALGIIWILIYLIVRKGTKSVGKVVMWTVPLPVILLLILFIRGITLPGAGAGIMTYITPDFMALLDFQIWSAAAAQIFFSLSIGFGVMIAYASYNRKNDVKSDAYTTSITNSLISIFAGFVVFSILGFMAYNGGVGVNEVSAGGPGLAFVVFPEAISQIPWAPLFAVLFFVTLLSLGIDSAFSLVEGLSTSIRDINPRLKTSAVNATICIVAFLLGLLFVTKAGLYFLDIVDHFVTNYVLMIVGIFQCIAIGWVYGAEKMRRYINSVSSVNVGKWWNHAIKYVIPIILTVLVVMQFITDVTTPYEGYPAWALTIGWLSAIIPLVIIIVFSLMPEKKKVKA